MSSSKVDTDSFEKNIKSNKKESEVAILLFLEKSDYNDELPEENFEIPEKLLLKEEKSKNESDNNKTLFNVLYNSLINKDHKSFLFCIQQNNGILIEEIVKQMNNDSLGKFIEKSLDIFQSNSFFTKIFYNGLKKS